MNCLKIICAPILCFHTHQNMMIPVLYIQNQWSFLFCPHCPLLEWMNPPLYYLFMCVCMCRWKNKKSSIVQYHVFKSVLKSIKSYSHSTKDSHRVSSQKCHRVEMTSLRWNVLEWACWYHFHLPLLVYGTQMIVTCQRHHCMRPLLVLCEHL